MPLIESKELRDRVVKIDVKTRNAMAMAMADGG